MEKEKNNHPPDFVMALDLFHNSTKNNGEEFIIVTINE